MTKLLVKVAAGKSSFRIVIPQKVIKEMGWDLVEYVEVKVRAPHEIAIKRLFNDEDPEKQDH